MTISLSQSFVRVAFALSILTSLHSARAGDDAALPVAIAPNHPMIRYTGRFDTRDAGGPRSGLPGSTIAVRFAGTALNALFTGNQTRFAVLIDGTSAGIVELHDGQKIYRVADHLAPNAPHTVELFQRTEALFGVAQFQGLQLETGRSLSELPARSQRRIEFIGDSITCGYGNEAASEKEHFSPKTENHYLAFGPLTARALGAEHAAIAWTGAFLSDKAPQGRKVIPQIYGRDLPDRAKSLHDFTKWIPQVVVINLGTNDFGGAAPDQADWVKQYRAFLAEIRSHYPQAKFFLCSGPMLGGGQLDALRKSVAAVAQAEKAEGKPVTLVEFPGQRYEDGLGADYHPSLKTHQKMADQLAAAIKAEMKW